MTLRTAAFVTVSSLPAATRKKTALDPVGTANVTGSPDRTVAGSQFCLLFERGLLRRHGGYGNRYRAILRTGERKLDRIIPRLERDGAAEAFLRREWVRALLIQNAAIPTAHKTIAPAEYTAVLVFLSAFTVPIRTGRTNAYR